MRKLAAWCAVGIFSYALGMAGDWLTIGGDPQHSGWQRMGKRLTSANVKEIQLLWKRRLDERLSAPVIIGPTITHRGVRELVFVAGAGDNLYAVDADLGTLFWKRHFDADASATPMIAPDEDASDEDIQQDDDDEAGEMRPIFAVASNGRMHAVRPSDGADTNAVSVPAKPAAGMTFRYQDREVTTAVNQTRLSLSASGKPLTAFN